MPNITGTTYEDTRNRYVEYTGTMSASNQTFTFERLQDGMTFRNKGFSAVILTVDGTTYNVPPNATIDIDDKNFISFDVRTLSGSHAFEIKAFAEKSKGGGGSDTELRTEFELFKTDTSSQLAQKLTKGEVSVTDINRNKGKFDQTYMTDEFLQQMAGTAPIHVVPADESITPIKTTFIDIFPSKNIFNPNAVTTGYFMDNGNLYANGSYAVSDYMEVPASMIFSVKYVNAGIYNIYTFDENKNYLEEISTVQSVSQFTFTITNPNAVYVRINVGISVVNYVMVVEGDTIPNTYLPYYNPINVLNNDIRVPETNVDISDTFVDSILQAKNTVNLFNRHDLNNIDGKILSNNVLVDNVSIFASHYIKIPTSKTVTIDYGNNNANTGEIFYYDKNKNYLGKLLDPSGVSKVRTFTITDSDAVYFRFNGYVNGEYFKFKDLTMVVEGSTLPTFYVEYAKQINAGYKSAYNQAFKGKRILFMGDSITVPVDEGGWVYWFNRETIPTSYVNTAVVGARWENSAGTVLDGNPTNSVDSSNTIPNQVQKVLNNAYPAFDTIIISAGTNNVSAGLTETVETYFTNGTNYIDVDTLDLTKTTAAIRWCVEKLQGAYPKAQIFLCTPIQGNEFLRPYVQIRDKGNKIKEVANRLAIPYFDNLNCGIYGKYENNGTAGKYLNDGLHPNMDGAKLLGAYVARKFINWYNFSA